MCILSCDGGGGSHLRNAELGVLKYTVSEGCLLTDTALFSASYFNANFEYFYMHATQL